MRDIELALALVLGVTVVATLARRLGLPPRPVTVLEGDSLVNDATALVAYRVAVAAVVTGAFSLADSGPRFLVASAGGVAVGVAVIVARIVWVSRPPICPG